MSTARKVALGLSAAGLVIAGYLTVVHYAAASAGCPLGGGAINCEDVLTSPYSTVGPIPVSLFGVVWFAVTGFLLLPRGLPGTLPVLRPWLWIGALTVLYLIYTELFLIGFICVWCSSVHLIVLALFVLGETGALSPSEE